MTENELHIIGIAQSRETGIKASEKAAKVMEDEGYCNTSYEVRCLWEHLRMQNIGEMFCLKMIYCLGVYNERFKFAHDFIGDRIEKIFDCAGAEIQEVIGNAGD